MTKHLRMSGKKSTFAKCLSKISVLCIVSTRQRYVT